MKRAAAVPGHSPRCHGEEYSAAVAASHTGGFTPFKEKTFYSCSLPVSFLSGQNYLEIDRTATCYYYFQGYKVMLSNVQLPPSSYKYPVVFKSVSELMYLTILIGVRIQYFMYVSFSKCSNRIG
jgi:hypothetical protein